MKKRIDNMFPDSLLCRENESPTFSIPQVHIVQLSRKCIPEQVWECNPVLIEMKNICLFVSKKSFIPTLRDKDKSLYKH